VTFEGPLRRSLILITSAERLLGESGSGAGDVESLSYFVDDRFRSLDRHKLRHGWRMRLESAWRKRLNVPPDLCFIVVPQASATLFTSHRETGAHDA